MQVWFVWDHTGTPRASVVANSAAEALESAKTTYKVAAPMVQSENEAKRQQLATEHGYSYDPY